MTSKKHTLYEVTLPVLKDGKQMSLPPKLEAEKHLYLPKVEEAVQRSCPNLEDDAQSKKFFSYNHRRGDSTSSSKKDEGFATMDQLSMTDYAMLDFMDKEILSENTNLYKTDDGTIFHHHGVHSVPTRLYVKCEGKEIDANLPGGESTLLTYSMQCHGNAIYFVYLRMLYKAIYNSSAGVIDVSYERDQLDGETIEEQTSGKIVCGRKRNGVFYLYRLCDDPERDGIAIESAYFNGDLRFAGIHWGKVIFTCAHTWQGPQNQNVIVLENVPPSETLAFSRDSSPFFYVITKHRTVIVLNIATNEILPFLRFSPKKRPYRIAWVHNGEIAVEKHGEGFMYLGLTDVLTAQLPKGYYDEPEPIEKDMVSSAEKQLRLSMRSSSGATADVFKSEFQTKFDTIKVLGQGGFGCVFEARHRLDRGKYAVKRIPLRGRQNDVDDALKEAITLASFDFKGIVRYNHSWIETPPLGWQRYSDEKLARLINRQQTRKVIFQSNYRDDCSFLYIQMELCKYTLSDWLRDHQKHRDLRKMKFWFQQIVAAVGYIHARKLIHRDLKPSNILFAGDELLKICDLGIVADRAIRNGQEVAGTRTANRGTLMYMAPEQRGFNYSSKVDIFALGLILIELCVVMTMDEAGEVFELYQRGLNPNVVSDPQMKHLVDWLTSQNATDRPDCAAILNHSFLA